MFYYILLHIFLNFVIFVFDDYIYYGHQSYYYILINLYF